MRHWLGVSGSASVPSLLPIVSALRKRLLIVGELAISMPLKESLCFPLFAWKRIDLTYLALSRQH